MPFRTQVDGLSAFLDPSTTDKPGLVANGFAAGSVGYAVATKTANYTATLSDGVIVADATGGNVTITLPTAVGFAGLRFIVKRKDASGNTVTIATTSSQTIDGATTKALASQWAFVEVVSDGANWLLVG
jgi:hypothetical protein